MICSKESCSFPWIPLSLFALLKPDDGSGFFAAPATGRLGWLTFLARARRRARHDRNELRAHVRRLAAH